MKAFAVLVAVLASSVLSAPTDNAHHRSGKDIGHKGPKNITAPPEPCNTTVPHPVKVVPHAHVKKAVAVDLHSRGLSLAEREAEKASLGIREANAILSSELEGMLEEKVAHYRSLAISQAREHFKRTFPASPWNSSAYNTTQPGYPQHGDPGCHSTRTESCGLFSRDDQCDSHCKKCGHGQGKCEGFMLFKSCQCS